MNDNVQTLRELNADECLARLDSMVLGRVVTRVGDVMDIFPVNYVLDAGEIVLRTAEGAKLAEMAIGREVLFEIDEYTDSEGWSVVVRGSARVLVTEVEIAAADALPLKPMAPTLKRNYVRIVPTTLTGRHFMRGEEPPRDGVQEY